MARIGKKTIKQISDLVADWVIEARTAIDSAITEGLVEVDEDGDKIVRAYLGTVFSIMPSGKYYTAWAASNVSEREAEIDELFLAAMEQELGKVHMWIEGGEGDPCDMFVGCHIVGEVA